MQLGTEDRTPPAFFRQGPSALSRLLVMSALSVMLMVVDARLQWTTPIRVGIAATLAPLQWLAVQPLLLSRWTAQYIGDLQDAQEQAQDARDELVRQAQRSAIVEHLSQENRELRNLLGMQGRLSNPALSANILYEVGDPLGRKIMVSRGSQHGVVLGSAVMDGWGVMGQVTRVFSHQSEVRLLTDRQQAIPVINTRTGQRSLAFGLHVPRQHSIELRFETVPTSAELGDVLTTSGMDGVYPPGLPVAHISVVDSTRMTGFARIEAQLLARMDQSMHVLIIEPDVQTSVAPDPTREATP